VYFINSKIKIKKSKLRELIAVGRFNYPQVLILNFDF